MPAVISPFPQMLSGLIAVINKLIDHGYPKAAADIVNLATISPPCSPPPPVQPPHWCPLSSPPPLLSTRRRRRGRRRRRSSSSSSSTSTRSSPIISAKVSQLISSITELPVTSAVDLEWEEFPRQEVKSKHVADLVDTCVDVATKTETSDHPTVDSVLPSMQNLLTIAAATEISFKEAEPIKALIADSINPKEEKTNVKAETHISRTAKVSKEAEEMNKLATSVDKLNTRRSGGISPYEPRKFNREDFPGLGDREVVFSAPVSLPCVDFKALGFGPRFLPRPELFPVQGCSQDPAIYLCVEGDDCRSSKHHYRRSDRRPDVTPYPPWHIGSAHSEPSPFGTLPGLETDVGITNLPETLFRWKYDSGTGRNTKWVMTSEVKVPSFSAKSRLLDPIPLCGPKSIPGAQNADESEPAATNALVDDMQPPLNKCEKTPVPTVCMAAKLSPTTWCSAPPPPAPPTLERRFPKLERQRRLSS